MAYPDVELHNLLLTKCLPASPRNADLQNPCKHNKHNIKIAISSTDLKCGRFLFYFNNITAKLWENLKKLIYIVFDTCNSMHLVKCSKIK